MSEQIPLPEYVSQPEPILQLARGIHTPFTRESESLLLQFKPHMDEYEKKTTLSSLQDVLQQADVQLNDSHQSRQVLRQIGIVLTTAHVHYISNSTWPQVMEELEDAYRIADQTGYAGNPAFNKIADQINLLINTLAQRQYRL